MSWRAITEADLLQKMTETELNAVSGVVYDVVDTVTSLVRGYVASNNKNELDADASKIPERLIGPACAVILVDAYVSLGGTLIDPKEHRKNAKDEALRLFRSVAKGEFSIADSITGEESSSGGASIVNKRTPRVTRENLGGF